MPNELSIYPYYMNDRPKHLHFYHVVVLKYQNLKILLLCRIHILKIAKRYSCILFMNWKTLTITNWILFKLSDKCYLFF